VSDNGDERLRNAGIVLPCAKQFGWLAGGMLSNCDRPYGHTGAHTAEGSFYSGGRDAEDEVRTVAVINRLASLQANPALAHTASPGLSAAPRPTPTG